MGDKKSCPYDIKPFTKEETESFRKYFTADKSTYVRVGPAGYVMPSSFVDFADDVYHLPLRTDDVFVVTFPRSGTTWTQELVWLVVNNLDFDKAKSIPLQKRYEFIEYSMIIAPGSSKDFIKDETAEKIWKESFRSSIEVLKEMKSQRFIKSHLPLSLLPNGILDTAKVVYVARDFRDVAVSYCDFYKSIKIFGLVCTLKEYYENIFSKNTVPWSPYFEHIKEAWALKDHPNMLFMFYEDMVKDLKSSAKRVADFFGKQYTGEQLDQLCSHLAFDNFQKNKAVDLQDLKQLGLIDDRKDSFIRKGKAGGWREVFDEEMSRHAETWMQQELQGTGLHFQS